MFKVWKCFITIICLATTANALAQLSIPMYYTADHGIGKSAGTVVISKTKYGLLFTPQLTGVTAGIHGFHIHENSSCDQNGMAAGGHFDPTKTGQHLGPYNDKGHFGDLPALYADANGSVTLQVLAPRIKYLPLINNRALMVHSGGDNYSDTPAKLGGGGTRMICGVINTQVS